MWRTHHGLLGACRVAIKHERWSDTGSREREERQSFHSSSLLHQYNFREDGMDVISSFNVLRMKVKSELCGFICSSSSCHKTVY